MIQVKRKTRNAGDNSFERSHDATFVQEPPVVLSDGRTPGARYYYQVVDDTNGNYGSGSFITAPVATAKSIKFLAFGVTRSTPLAMEGIIQEMRKIYAADPAYQTIAVQAGDWVASDGETNWTNEWFNANPQTRQLLAARLYDGVPDGYTRKIRSRFCRG